DAFITMGTKALWFGIDAASHPEEIAHWYSPSGFGNGWSQRLTSPTFTNGNYRLTFDCRLGNSIGGLASSQTNRFIAVQALRDNGTWAFLSARAKLSSGSTLTSVQGNNTGPGMFTGAIGFRGQASIKISVATSPDSQLAFPFATPTQLRIVVQTTALNSDE